MIIGTLCLTQSSHVVVEPVVRLVHDLVDRERRRRPVGMGRSWAASSSVIRASHSSSSSGGRAFSDGNEPTTPALHCAITSSGTEMMKSGEPITGIDRRPLNKAGMDIGETILWWRSKSKAGSHTNKAIFPLSSIAF